MCVLFQLQKIIYVAILLWIYALYPSMQRCMPCTFLRNNWWFFVLNLYIIGVVGVLCVGVCVCVGGGDQKNKTKITPNIFHHDHHAVVF